MGPNDSIRTRKAALDPPKSWNGSALVTLVTDRTWGSYPLLLVMPPFEVIWATRGLEQAPSALLLLLDTTARQALVVRDLIIRAGNWALQISTSFSNFDSIS
jgi:hypothetical protein